MSSRRFMQRIRKDQNLAEETASHLAHEGASNMDRGLPTQEAHRQAGLRFGNPDAMREHVWRYRSVLMVDDVLRDLRFAIRSLTRTCAFTAIALLVIAVGIGVNTAVFSVVNGVLLKPLTYPNPESMVNIVTTSDRGSLPLASVPEFNLWQQKTSIFEQVAVHDWGRRRSESHRRELSQAVTSLCSAPCIILLVTLLASWLAARRATQIDSTVALRCK